MSASEFGVQASTAGSESPVGALYLHVPFCVRRCAYCDFASSTLAEGSTDRLLAYARSLSRLLRDLSSTGLLSGVRTAYIGGGTPTTLGMALPGLIEEVGRLSPAPLEELTFEANPDSSTRALFSECRRAGATRVSIGVQSTDDVVLGNLGRLHDARQALHALSLAGDAGLRVSADLMAGVPGQSPGSLREDVRRVASHGVGHVSVYALEVHGGTPYGALESAGLLDAPDEDATADLLEGASEALGACGFERYEVSNYARPGECSRHNLAYWTGVPYLGLGPSAASMVDGAAYRMLRDLHPGLPEPPANVSRIRLTCASSIAEVMGSRTIADLSFEVEGLTERQAMAEDLMLASRLADGITRDLVARSRPLIGPVLDGTVAGLVEDGLLVESEGGYRPTERGWLLGNVIYGALWGLADDEGSWTG